MCMIRTATLPATAALVKCGRVTRLFVFVFRGKRATLLVLQAVCIAVVLRLSRSCSISLISYGANLEHSLGRACTVTPQPEAEPEKRDILISSAGTYS